MSSARAYAHTNIALVKYWGKRAQATAAQRALNLPATGSLSLTLDRFGTDTTVTFVNDASDSAVLDGNPVEGAELTRISAFLDLIRARAQSTSRVRIESRNDVPTAAGLASSASGFAALALAGSKAFGLDLDATKLSALARQGSGSAARSLFGGFARLECGVHDDSGEDAVARAIPTAADLDVRLLVVRCAQGRKKVGSTVGMNRTMETSPYYAAWVSTHAKDLDDATAAIAAGDFGQVGAIMERSTLKMHASALAATPGLWYFAPATIAVMNAVRDLRDDDGIECFFTMDAGPHVKVLCREGAAEALATTLGAIDGVFGVDIAAPGPAAHLIESSDATVAST